MVRTGNVAHTLHITYTYTNAEYCAQINQAFAPKVLHYCTFIDIMVQFLKFSESVYTSTSTFPCIPLCVSAVVDCGRLSDILNGRVQVSTTTFGSTATYVCDPGYSVVGTAVRSCLAVGVWSGREPSCTSKMCECMYCNYTMCRL